MTLRSQIESKIRLHPEDPEKAALAICVLLEWEIGLAGNGWFDDDQKALEAIESSSP